MKTPARFFCLCMSPAIDATVTLPAEYCRRLFGAGAAAEEAAVWAVAAGSAACTRPGGLPPSPEAVAKLKGCHETL
jgi:hypothetical protein